MSGRNASRREPAGRKESGLREGASQSRTAWRDQFRGWLRHHRLSAAESLFRVFDKPFSSFLTWMVIGIALALPVGLNVALSNVDQLSASWQSPSQISLFLGQTVTPEEGKELHSALKARADIRDATFVSREEALEEFRSLSGFGDVLGSLQENPLPNVILVSPLQGLSSEALSALRDELLANVDVSEAVLDMAWLQRLNRLMELSRRVVVAVGCMLVLGVLLILGNTIRLAIEGRRDEIVIVKLVGGSNAFVRRPFLYTGLWYGVGGGMLAAAVVALALWFVQEPVAGLAILYDSDFHLRGLGVMGALNLVILGGLLGLSGAWLAVGRHLSQIEPR